MKALLFVPIALAALCLGFLCLVAFVLQGAACGLLRLADAGFCWLLKVAP